MKNQTNLIKYNAENGYVFVAETRDGIIYKNFDGHETSYFIDEGYDCGALAIWNTFRSKETLEAVLKDIAGANLQKEHSVSGGEQKYKCVHAECGRTICDCGVSEIPLDESQYSIPIGYGVEDIKQVWDAALTLANNTAVQISDNYNNDDYTAEADAAVKCATKIRGYIGEYSILKDIGIDTESTQSLKPTPKQITEEEINKMAEDFADSKERRGCAYWSGLRDGFKAALELK